MPESQEHSLRRAAELVRARSGFDRFDVALILGSGMSDAMSALDCLQTVPFADIPGAPAPPIAGHAGTLAVCCCDELRVLAFQGRFHCYQGLSAADAAWPVMLADAVGVSHLLMTSAVGGIASHLSPGDLVQVRDHLNLLGDNPLTGLFPSPFVDLVDLYTSFPFARLQEVFQKADVPLSQGVLAAMPGPSYETPAEISMLKTLGADVVSMSMVPEAIMARHLSIHVLGLALVTNYAAGLSTEKLQHSDVVAAGAQGGRQLAGLLPEILRAWMSL